MPETTTTVPETTTTLEEITTTNLPAGAPEEDLMLTQEVPQGAPALPKTAGFPVELFMGLGLGLTGVGATLKIALGKKK